jgi:hypothetical protein
MLLALTTTDNTPSLNFNGSSRFALNTVLFATLPIAFQLSSPALDQLFPFHMDHHVAKVASQSKNIARGQFAHARTVDVGR